MPSSSRKPRCFIATAPTAEMDRLADRAVEVFQPCTSERLTRADGAEILDGLVRYIQLLAAWDADSKKPADTQVPVPGEPSENAMPPRRGPGRRPRRARRAQSPEYIP